MARIFAYIVHKNGVADDTAFEFIAAAKAVDSAATVTALVTGDGADLDRVCEQVRTQYREVWKIANEKLAYPNAELIRKALAQIIPSGSVVLIPHNHFGLDLAPGLSIKLDAAFVSDVVAINGIEGNYLKVVRQEFGGLLSTHVRCSLETGAVINVRPGAFKPEALVAVNGAVLDKSAEVGPITAGRRYIETLETNAGDVDISKEPVLVSIGRGIQEKDNVTLAQELAKAMGATVSCSRPVVDAKWLDKSRQVGSSGQTVKPKIYLACGISGSFQHLAGIKGSPFIVAINKNPKAPIFQVADVGVVADLMEFLPVLTNKIRAM